MGKSEGCENRCKPVQAIMDKKGQAWSEEKSKEERFKLYTVHYLIESH